MNFNIQKKEKLNALIFLRFLAALSIAVFHFQENFGFFNEKIVQCCAGPAVSFFFILSGFILTYAYPSFKDVEDKKKFYVARIARVWPLHFLFFSIVALLACFGLIYNLGKIKIAILNIFLVHSWIPITKSFFSFNSVSWSISTEFFFYLLFPFIINKWSTTWHWKILGIFLLPIILIFGCAYFKCPIYSTNSEIVNNVGVLYINPLARLPEFVIGMTGCWIWMKYRNLLDFNYFTATYIEIGATGLTFLSMYFYWPMHSFFLNFIPQYINAEFSFWSSRGIYSSVPFVLLLMVFASGNGVISRIISHRFCILLGEISFSIYLCHQILNRFYLTNPSFFVGIPEIFLFFSYWTIVFMGSFLLWKYVECPARKWTVNTFLLMRQKKLNPTHSV